MAKNNQKMVDAITSMDEDFAQWYTDIVKKAELSSYTSVKGCMVIRPYGYAIWEQMQHILDETFKETGHENVCMPMFIPESLLQKEKRPCRRLCTGSCMGHTRRFGKAGRTALCASDIRNPVLRPLCRNRAQLSGFAETV